MTAPKDAIKVGLIGLSAGGGWAPASHLPYLQSSDKYVITAVCNSSLGSSKRAIAQYKLASAQPFSSVEAMCEGDTVQLVVCVVVVYSHYKLVEPAIQAGKDVYVEWPLCGRLEESRELLELSRHHEIRTIVGLQARAGHVRATLQQVLDSGSIGRVLATHMVGSAGSPETGDRVDRRYLYFKEREFERVPQTALMIYVGHTMDLLASLLGEPETVSAQLQTTWPSVQIVDGDTVLEQGVAKSAADYASINGVTERGVKYTYVLRGGDSFEAGDGLVWDIIGDKGQIRVTGGTIMFNIGAENYRMQVKDYATGSVEKVPLAPKLRQIPLLAQNVGMVYENYAEGGLVPTFEDAVKRHEFFNRVLASSEGGRTVSRDEYI